MYYNYIFLVITKQISKLEKKWLHWNGLLDIFFILLKFKILNHVNIIKTKVLLPQA